MGPGPRRPWRGKRRWRLRTVSRRGGDAERVTRHEERPHEERPGEKFGRLEVPTLKLNEECLAENKLKTGVRSRHANGDYPEMGLNTRLENITRDYHFAVQQLYACWTNLFICSVIYRAAHGMHAWSPPIILGPRATTMARDLSASSMATSARGDSARASRAGCSGSSSCRSKTRHAGPSSGAGARSGGRRTCP